MSKLLACSVRSMLLSILLTPALLVGAAAQTAAPDSRPTDSGCSGEELGRQSSRSGDRRSIS